jgi:hypothetical protein
LTHVNAEGGLEVAGGRKAGGGGAGVICGRYMRPRSTAKARYSVYVIELDARIWNHTRFREANPDHDISKPCVYVGMTGLSVEARFANHRRGYKSNPYVTRYGVRLLPKLYLRLNPMGYDLARITEVTLAQRLKAQGYAVWQA